MKMGLKAIYRADTGWQDLGWPQQCLPPPPNLHTWCPCTGEWAGSWPLCMKANNGLSDREPEDPSLGGYPAGTLCSPPGLHQQADMWGGQDGHREASTSLLVFPTRNI